MHCRSELDGLREKDQSRQSESQAQATQSAALMSMNIKLQSSASKNQAKTIDLELRKLDAAQARELLDITQVRLRRHAVRDVATDLFSLISPKFTSRATKKLPNAICSSRGSHSRQISSIPWWPINTGSQNVSMARSQRS